MNSYTLYGSQGSGAAAAEAALALAGVPYRRVEAASWEPGPGLDELMRVNPLAQIPTLVLPDGTVMTESAAILIHLGLAHPASGLLPRGANCAPSGGSEPASPASVGAVITRAHVMRGLVYVAANCYAAIGVIDFPERYCKDADEAMRKRIKAGTTERLHYLWDVFADTFPATPWLTGDMLGALDVLATVVSKWSGARKHLASARPQLSAVFAKVENDPRLAPIFARHWPS